MAESTSISTTLSDSPSVGGLDEGLFQHYYTHTPILPSGHTSLERPQRRYFELDAVRGIAALVVLSQHFADLFPASDTGVIAKLHQHPWGGSQIVTLIKILPVGVIFRGSSAVATFFVLSGFVLSLPFLSTRGRVSWPRFVFKRLTRLYLPFLAAFLLSVFCSRAFSRHGIGALSDWFNRSWSSPPQFADVLSHAFLINHIDYSAYNVAFWTLAYEMQISLVFPGLFWLSTRLRGRYLLCVSILLMIVGTSTLVVAGVISILGSFLLGIGLARYRNQLIQRCATLSTHRRGILGIAVLFAYNYAPSLSRSSSQNCITTVLLALTAALAVVLALTDFRWGSVLNSRPCQFLGRISYSLYLVHLTVLYVLLYETYQQFSARLGLLYWPMLVIAYLGLSLLTAWLFFRVIEQPCTSLSHMTSWHTR